MFECKYSSDEKNLKKDNLNAVKQIIDKKYIE